MTTLHDLLNEFRALSSDERSKGLLFEKMIASYLLADPQYAALLSDVWLWGEWPDRWGSDDGIDLVARERSTGEYWAIQCKFYAPSHSIQKADIDSFFTASGKRFATTDGERSFANRVIVSTTDKWSDKAEIALADQSTPVFKLTLQDLADSPVDWSSFSLKRVQDIHLKAKKTPREHQTEAIGLVVEGFQSSDRGKLIMACGTGKTFTSLRLMEQLVPEGGRVLFLAPSISLVAQTLREWTAEALTPIHAFVVCSDTKVGKDEEDIRTQDLAYPATTDARKIALHTQAVTAGRRTVVFSTYQSIQVLGDAQKQGLGDFDLIICDEAHRTTGLTLPGEDPSDFVIVHHNHLIKGSKRLYMTATPRIFAEKSKNKASDNDAVLFSMDDVATYGPEFYRLGFGKAVDKNLLAEYKVLIVAVDEDKMAALANDFNAKAFQLDAKHAIDSRFATKIIGCWKGLSKQDLVDVGEDGQQEARKEDTAPMRRAVAFSKTIKDSRQTIGVFEELTKLYLQGKEDSAMVRCKLHHVDGAMNSQLRQSELEWLKQEPEAGQCRILSNARCLSEGIDVPALDAVVFFDTRESMVDIVQSVGRVMRKSEGKQYGYIILPVAIPSSKVQEYNDYVSKDKQFKGIWKVIKALRAHDESLVDEAEFRRKVKIISGSNGGGDGGGGGQIDIKFPDIPIDDLTDAVYAAIPTKLGDREYWSEWAKSVAQIAERLMARIRELLKRKEARVQFAQFLKGLQDTLNPAVNEDAAIEMLAQHILTRPIFEALFQGYSFTENNPVSKAMQTIIQVMDEHAVGSETSELEKFYTNIRERVSLAKSDKSRQDVIRNLYDTFFKEAFPRMAERLGIVYTPVEVVDFILQSVEVALQKHFNASLNDKGVQVIDPFTGTGTFIARLLQSGLITPEALPHKYAHELHANELVLLAYYIASINIESTYHGQTGSYEPFNGIVLTDTFQISEDDDIVDKVVLPENNERITHQLKQDIRVIIGNPPYSAGQTSANDNNQNLDYPTLDGRIRDTYAELSSATNKNSLYDSYIRAIRWASDRLMKPGKYQGIVAFVTNGKFIESNVADGLRKCLTDEFSHLYIFNLRGFIRGKSGDDAKREGQNIFNIMTGVAITLLVKDPNHQGSCELHYHDIGDYLTRDEKLSTITGFGSMAGVPWQPLTPNTEGDWINARNPEFETFIELGNKEDKAEKNPQAIFSTYSCGVQTNRDTWVYNFQKDTISSNMDRMIATYNNEVVRYLNACKGKSKEHYPELEKFVESDPKQISWSSSLLPLVARNRKANFSAESIVYSLYRPFTKQWFYFDRMMNHRPYLMPRLFPSSEHHNVVISVTGIGGRKPFSALATNTLPDLELVEKGQCFPLYWYEKVEENGGKQQQPAQTSMFATYADWEQQNLPDEYGYIKHEAITDWALQAFQERYGNTTITKEDIFSYVYGILHSPEYKSRFASDLKKMLPRIPFATDFGAFSGAGDKLSQLHLRYETIEPYPLQEENKRMIMEAADYRVQKMAFGKTGGKPDKSVIVYNGNVTLRGIPLEAYGYVVNGKSALEWVMERYAVTKDKDSGITNDANQWSDDPRYIVELVKRVVTVSVESVRIVAGLPGLGV